MSEMKKHFLPGSWNQKSKAFGLLEKRLIRINKNDVQKSLFRAMKVTINCINERKIAELNH